MRLDLPQSQAPDAVVALYDRMQRLSALGYTTVLGREADSGPMFVRSFLGTVDGGEAAVHDAFPWSTTPRAVERWVRISFSVSRDLLRAWLCEPQADGLE